MAKKRSFLIGLGGSGGKVISKLYNRITEEKADYDHVTCIAIDTDQAELNELEKVGVKTVCISGADTVGQIINDLGDDVTDWCPNTGNEGIFYSSPVHNGASQCRLKSRLCFAGFLKNTNNDLQDALETALMVSSQDENISDAPPSILIASSIAGGTGSGIFIQTALYVKKFFRDRGIDVEVHGLFACPDLYAKVVTPQQLPSLYANAYAVIRELNAFNLICGDADTSAYGGSIDIDIEISTSCEGRLFEKDSDGRYGYKPYDVLYFIDRTNYLKKIIGGLNDYYEAMANIAYSHLYSDISEKVLSRESNEMSAHSMAPCAVYGSAGASAIKYPYKDILRYFANKSIAESINSVWVTIDNDWKNYCKAKDASAIAMGLSKYIPTPSERAEAFIRDFNRSVKNNGISVSKMSFLAPMVVSGDISKAEILMNTITTRAESLIENDNKLADYKKECGIGNTETTKNALSNSVKVASAGDSKDNMFSKINSIDKNLESYCAKGLSYVADMAIQFSNEIFCDDQKIWGTFDASPIGLINNLLYDSEKRTWIHPIAARYLLYAFKEVLNHKIKEVFGDIDTEDDDLNDFYNYLVKSSVRNQKEALSTSSKNKNSNASILKEASNKIWGKKSTLGLILTYFNTLGKNINSIDEVFVDALLYFSLARVRARLDKLIAEYELFFDNIDEFAKKADAAVVTSEIMHDESTDVVYVCSSAEIKKELYESVGRNIDLQTGETAGIISKALFDEMRNRAFKEKTDKKRSAKETLQNLESFFRKVSDIVAQATESNSEIQGSLNMNVFQALLYEYSLVYPDCVNDEIDYSQDSRAKSNIDTFISKKFAALVKMSAPLLVYDEADTYSRMFDKKDENGNIIIQKPAVSNAYRFLSHNAEVSDSIFKLLGGDDRSSALMDFYSDKSTSLPKDSNGQTIKFELVGSGSIDPYTILCYSTVHCLQPYQINAFDEIKGGVYYEHYAKRIAEMERFERYSLTPHLDKRWHKHGTMPYINVSKENERRYDLAKAFLYALCYGKIGYAIDGSDIFLVYKDSALGKDAEIIFFNGKFIPYNKLNRAMNWLADQDNLIERYSSLFDMEIDKEIDKLSKYTDNVGRYKTSVTNYARILNQMKRNILRSIDVVGSGNGRAKQKKTKDPINVIELAWKLHRSEENETDKNYGELLIDVLCQTIKRYAKAPYNIRKIEEKQTGTDAYINYSNVKNHIANAFLTLFASTYGIKPEELNTIEEPAVEETQTTENTAFGVDNTDLEDGYQVTKTSINSLEVKWANDEINKCMAE